MPRFMHIAIAEYYADCRVFNPYSGPSISFFLPKKLKKQRAKNKKGNFCQTKQSEKIQIVLETL